MDKPLIGLLVQHSLMFLRIYLIVLFRLIALMLCTLAFSTTSGVMVGLLDPMALDLGVSVEAVGQLQSVFAVACGIAGPVIARATVAVNKKKLLLIVLVALIGINIATALADRFDILLAIRTVGGAATALTLPLASGLVFGFVEPEKRSSSLAFVISGNTLSLLIGVPIGSVIGAAFGWESAFGFAALLSLIALTLVMVLIPDQSAQQKPPENALKVAVTSRTIRLYGVTLLAFTSVFCTVSYLGPVITIASGVSGAGIGFLQVLVGVGGLVGLAIGARLAGSQNRLPIFCLFGVIVINQLFYAINMLFDLGTLNIVLLLIAIPIGPMSLFGMAPIIQTRLAMETGTAVTLALAINASLLFLGQGVGAVVGGGVTFISSLPYIGFAGAGLALLGLLLAYNLPKPMPADQ